MSQQQKPSAEQLFVAMRMTLKWLLPLYEAAAICTDSQSLLKAIQRGSAETIDLRRMLNK